MIELIEHTEAQEEVYTQMYQASVGWDGRAADVRALRGRVAVVTGAASGIGGRSPTASPPRG